jgi:L-ribulose-5-phosphate 3-epimerase
MAISASRLAVCSWSLQSANPLELLQQVKEIGISRVQIALDPLRNHPEIWGSLPELCHDHHVTLVSGMFGTVGEDYSTLETIKRTGGVVPDSTWDANWRNIQATADLAHKLKLNLVTFHAGFLPHEPSDPAFTKLFERMTMIVDAFGQKGIELGLETGQETADTLRSFLERLNKKNVGVNLDPANMILYDKGDPVAAMRVLGPWLKQCHLKDAVKTKVPGAWGDEVVLGKGQVDWHAFFATAEQVHFRGDFAIEREAGDQRIAEIRAAKEYVLAIK